MRHNAGQENREKAVAFTDASFTTFSLSVVAPDYLRALIIVMRERRESFLRDVRESVVFAILLVYSV